MSELYDAHHRYFEIVMANTQELKKEAFRLRYQVLCVEKRLPGFDSELYPEEMEYDNYDSHSIHALIKFRSTGMYIGTLRLILSDPSNPHKPFPIEEYTQPDTLAMDIHKLPRTLTAEISRFLVIDKFNRRRDENSNPVICCDNSESPNDSTSHSRERRTTNLVLMLAGALVRITIKHNIHNWLSVMDPSLNRLLSHFSMHLNTIGPYINYHGRRRPYFGSVWDILNRIQKKHPEVWELITDHGEYSQEKLKLHSHKRHSVI